MLHVAFQAPGSIDPDSPDIYERSIAVDGTVGAPVAVQSNWAALNAPDLVAAQDGVGLAAFFGGIRSLDPGETNKELNMVTSPDSGATWNLTPGSIGPPGTAYASPMSATRLGDVYWQGWGGSGTDAWVHRGTSSASPDISLQDRIGGGCCGYDVNLAADPVSNTVLVSWYSNATVNQGVFGQLFDAAGTPVGNPVLMPGSTSQYQGKTESTSGLERVPTVLVPGRGYALAYPSGYPTSKRIVLWAPPSTTSTTIAHTTSGVAGLGLAAAADGWLWVAWSQNQTLYARRSNAAGTAWGAIVTIGPPKHTGSIWKVDADANPGGPLDLFTNVDTPGSTAFWHTQVLPGLSLSASPTSVHHKPATHVTFTVSDAGDPVAGAKVKVGGVSGTTSAAGTVSLTLGPFAKKVKHVTATATRAGYSNAALKLKVKP